MDENTSKLKFLIDAASTSVKDQEMKAAHYMLDNEDRILELSVNEIAEGSGVSKATVVRFCKKLGFSGLKEFKIFYRMGRKKSTSSNSPITWESSDRDVFDTMLERSSEVLDKVMNQGNYNTLEEVSDSILRAHNIDIIAVGGSVIVADYLRVELFRLGKRVNVYTDHYTINTTNFAFTSDDLVFAISCSGESPSIIRFAENARKNGTKVVAITNNKESSLGRKADLSLISVPLKSFDDDGNMLSRISMFTLINTMFIFIALRLGRNDQSYRENFFRNANYDKVLSKES